MTNDAADEKPLLLLVDGHSLAFRAYYAFAKKGDGGLRTRTGIPTSVCFGFLKLLLEVLLAQKPQALAIAFDLGGPTFRHAADTAYKANREEAPQDFRDDVDNLLPLLEALRLPILVESGYEADDVLGTMAAQGQAAGYRVEILSGDRDLFQLVTPREDIRVLYFGSTFGRSGTSTLSIGPEQVIEKLGVPPEQVIDYKALCGDSSDNIPGVRGIGPKTAVQLLQAFGSLDEIYTHLEAIKPAVRQKLESGRAEAYHSQHLARIVMDVPVVVRWEDCQLTGFDRNQVTPLLERLEMQSFLKQIDRLQSAFGGLPVAKPQETAAESEGDAEFWSYADTQALARPTLRPGLIQTPEQLTALVAHLQTCRTPNSPVAWDTETSSLDPRQAELIGLGCCWGKSPEDLAYIPLGHTQGQQLPLDRVLEALRPLLESVEFPKVLQNAKYDRLVLRHQGIELRGVVFDTMLASYVLNPSTSHNLTDLGLRWLQVHTQSYSDLVGKGRRLADVPITEVARYCGEDVWVTWCLVEPLSQQLQQSPKLDSLFKSIELPLEPILADMEDVGIRIDSSYLQELSEQFEIDLRAIEQRAYEAAGEVFNLGSPKQLSELLFDKLGLNRKKSRKTKTGWSTDAAVLEKLQGDHAVVDATLEYRTLAKLKSTYVDALPALADEQGRIHTDFNQAVTTTGRLSSSNPNLQNIPIRTEFSRRIRKAFLPQEGWLLVAADYSQIELRILAHLSQEPVLLEAFRRGDDVHELTAQLLLDQESISTAERRLGKIINFGVIYGMGAQRFARETGVSSKEAQGFIQRFYERYPCIFNYLQQMEKEALGRGYVETILGRRRYFQFSERGLGQLQGQDPETIDLDKLRPDQQEAALLRAAANAPIQGSSADIIKLAMVKLDPILKPYQARLLLQVHDELVFELPPEEYPHLKPAIQNAMAEALPLSIPLEVEISAGANWMEAKA
jgi:DNA polymerase I